MSLQILIAVIMVVCGICGAFGNPEYLPMIIVWFVMLVLAWRAFKLSRLSAVSLSLIEVLAISTMFIFPENRLQPLTVIWSMIVLFSMPLIVTVANWRELK